MIRTSDNRYLPSELHHYVLITATTHAAKQAIHDAAWAIIVDCGETSGVREWPEGSGQLIWWKGAPTGDGCAYADYGADGYESTIKSGIACEGIIPQANNKQADKAPDYIRISDDEDGEVRVDDNAGGIRTFTYANRDERGGARRAAEKLAARLAKERDIDWGCNY